MSEEMDTWKPANAKPVNDNRLRNLVLLYIVIVLSAFLAGFLPMWSKARANEKEMKAMGGELRDLRLQMLLANATIDARRGDYEPARRAASDFFTRLSAPEAAGMAIPKDQVTALMGQRDEIITLLARSDPASAERLTSFYVAFRTALGWEIQALPVPVSATSTVPLAPKTNEPASTNQ